jgi:acyl carrier protein
MSDIQSEDLLREDLGLDSLMLVTLMVLLEEEFHIEFLAADLDPFALIMVQDVEELVNRYIAGG